MLDELREVSTERKVRLFLTACCRRICGEVQQPQIVDVSEAFADGMLGADALCAAHRETVDVHTVLERARDNSTAIGVIEAARGLGPELNRGYVAGGTLLAARSLATEGRESGMRLLGGMPMGEPDLALLRVARAAEEAELAAQADLLRDIFGNPFRPVTFSTDWRTCTVVSLARQMYDARDFGAIPILADALQDAGCDNDDILGHCRGPGPHVRGCWVVDLVLGKGSIEPNPALHRTAVKCVVGRPDRSVRGR
jgi:hypothetical protein